MFLKRCLFLVFINGVCLCCLSVFYISVNQRVVSDLQTCCLMHVLRVPDIARQA